MTNHIIELQKLLLESAAHIDEHGHHQFDMWDGVVCCIMGAPRMVANEKSYSHMLRSILAHLGYDERWNDVPGRTKEEVVAALESCVDKMTPETLEAVYGPRWVKILDLISEVDNWTELDYNEVAADSAGEEYPPTYATQNPQYLNSLAGYIVTVMTSGMSDNSMPFKRRFDAEYKTITGEADIEK